MPTVFSHNLLELPPGESSTPAYSTIVAGGGGVFLRDSFDDFSKLAKLWDKVVVFNHETFAIFSQIHHLVPDTTFVISRNGPVHDTFANSHHFPGL